MLHILETISKALNRVMAWTCGLVLLAMVGLACANMVLRVVAVPISGTFELLGFGGAIVAAFSLGYTQEHRGHIAVTVLTGKLPKPLERVLDGLGSLLGAAFFALAAWEVYRLGAFVVKTGELSETLHLVFSPFIFAVALGAAVMCLALVVDVLKDLASIGSKERPA